MKNITYHSFREEDCQEALNLWTNVHGVHLHSNGEDSIYGITAYLERNPGLSFVAKHDGKIIGAVMCGHDGRRGFIHHLAVDNQFRKLGIGKSLLQMSLEQLKKNKHKKMFTICFKRKNCWRSFL